MWPSFYAIFRKEFLHMFRDRGTLRLIVMIPIMQMILYGFIDETVRNVATVVVDQDRSVDSQAFMEQMTATRTFRITHLTTDPREARREIRSGAARVAVVIPAKFHDRKLRGESAQVLILMDGSDSTVSSAALAAINGLVAQDNLERAGPLKGGLSAQPIILFNPQGRTSEFLLPGLVAILLMMVGVVLSTNAIVREREQGTFEQLLVTPIHPVGLVLGKAGPYLFAALFEMAAALFLMRFVFGVHIRGSLVFLFLASTLYLFSLLALGILISTKARTQMEGQQLAQSLLLPSVFLSGYIFPLEGFPLILRVIGHLFPVTYMINIMRGVILRDATFLDLWPNVAVLAGMGVVLIFWASKSIHKVAQ